MHMETMPLLFSKYLIQMPIKHSSPVMAAINVGFIFYSARIHVLKRVDWLP